ncbi:MAG TPA: glycosyltransferase family 4 protein [Candidatus Binatia bacterium]|nr:glycosyltransferase family 4 protein [Candidatus Binatia bacterium]
MHPLIVTPLYPPAIGGAATHFGIIAPALRDHPAVERVTVLTERLSGEPTEPTEGSLRIVRRLPRHVGLAYRQQWRRALGYVRTQWWFHRNLAPLVRQIGADVIHLHARYRGRVLYAALRRTGVPVIANLHDKLTPPRRAAHVAQVVLCCAEGVREFAIRDGVAATQVRLVPLPLALPAAASSTTIAEQYHLTPKNYVLFAGEITRRKGVYELLAGYRAWRSDGSMPLALAGTNWEGKRFIRQVQQTPGAVYLGPVPHAETIALMREAAVVVLPSHSEGLPYVILEAIAMGTKVISPPGIPEFGRHLPASVLTEVSAAAISRALEQVAAETGSPSYPLAQHDPARVLDELVQLYAETVRPHGRRD